MDTSDGVALAAAFMWPIALGRFGGEIWQVGKKADNDVLVFGLVEGAGAIDQQTARPKERESGFDNLDLAGAAADDAIRRPFVAGGGIPAKEAFA